MRGQCTRSHTSENCVPAVDLEQVYPFHQSAHLSDLLFTFPSTAGTKDAKQRKTFSNLGKNRIY